MSPTRWWPATAEDSLHPRTVWLALAATTIVAAALRLPFLDHQSLWFDEINTLEIVREPALSGLWHHVRATESTPPLYYVLAWLAGADGAAGMRVISAVALIAAGPVGYLAFHRWIGQRAALATAAILAVSPVLVSYATNARSYGLLVLTALLSVWSFSVLLQRSSPRHFALWVAASLTCVWTHYFGAFVIAAEITVLLVTRPRERLVTVAWSGVLGVGLTPLVVLVADQAGDERAQFIAGIPLSTRLSSTVRQFAMGPNVPTPWLEGCGLAMMCLAVAVGCVMAVRTRREPLALAAIALGAPLLLAMTGIEDRFYARNVIAAAPLAAALASPALLWLRAAPLAIYLVLAAVTSVWVATDWRYEQADWQHALARTQSIDKGAAVVTVTGRSLPVVRTYLARRAASAAGVVARRAWIVVEPARKAGNRALGPAPQPTLPGFSKLRTLELHGFRLILVQANRPTPITPADIPGSGMFAAPAIAPRDSSRPISRSDGSDEAVATARQAARPAIRRTRCPVRPRWHPPALACPDPVRHACEG